MASSIRIGKRVTLKDVAKRAGVSVGMASRVLGEYGSYSEATRQRVMEAATALHYRPNALARSLRVGSTKAIGVVVSNIRSHAWTAFIRSVEAAATRHGYQVILGATSDDPAAEHACLTALHERSVDAIIASPAAENRGLVDDIVDSGVPIVLIGRYPDDVGVPRVTIDGRSAATTATEHLLDLGHTRIGIVTGDLDRTAGRERLDGYHDALSAAGVEFDEELVGRGNFRFGPAHAATLEMLDLPNPPTALLACNEVMAGGALQALKDRGVTVPDEMSLVAFDDPPWTEFYRPGITTVRTPQGAMAELAVMLMFARLHDPTSPDAAPIEHLVPTEFVVRESTVAPRRLT